MQTVLSLAHFVDLISSWIWSLTTQLRSMETKRMTSGWWWVIVLFLSLSNAHLVVYWYGNTCQIVLMVWCSTYTEHLLQVIRGNSVVMIEALEPVAKAQWTFSGSRCGSVVKLVVLIQNCCMPLGMFYPEFRHPYSSASLSTFVYFSKIYTASWCYSAGICALWYRAKEGVNCDVFLIWTGVASSVYHLLQEIRCPLTQ